MMTPNDIHSRVERIRHQAREKLPETWDASQNTRNDWLAFAMTHLGRAVGSHASNEVFDPEEEVLKTMALLEEGLMSGRFSKVWEGK